MALNKVKVSMIEEDIEDIFVNVVGDTMTGDLQIDADLRVRNNLSFTNGIDISDGNIKWLTGEGEPQGLVSASVGSLYTNTTALPGGGTLFIKTSGDGNIGWEEAGSSVGQPIEPGDGTNTLFTETFQGNGINNTVTLKNEPFSINNTQVYVSGVYQLKHTYSLAGKVITFSEPPPEGRSIEVVIAYSVTFEDSEFVNTTGDTMTGKLTIEDDLDVTGTVTAGAFVGDGAVPRGLISLWYGSVSSIPTGYFLCDGTNGTPDLRNSFVRGAGSSYNPGDKGGSNTSALSTANLPAHTHTDGNYAGSTSNNGAHNHTINGGGAHGHTNVAAGNHNHTINAGGAHGHNGVTGNNGAHNHTINGGGAHGHNGVTGNNGAHSHNISPEGRGVDDNYAAWAGNVYRNRRSSHEGNHSHNISAYAVGNHGHNNRDGGNHSHNVSVYGVGNHGHNTVAAGNHNHTINAAGNHGHNTKDGGNHSHNFNVGGTSGSTGSGTSFAITPQYYALAYIMKG
jgi:hypothetical protein